MNGTRPPGAKGEAEAAHWVRQMFGSVAHRYDFLNHLLSFGLDRSWRLRTVARVEPVLLRPGARVLDLCCGTGDLLLALQERRGAPVWGCDFCRPMLDIAREKVPSPVLIETDAMHLPVRDAALDLLTVAFGFRNFPNYRAGLEEMARVLRPGGVAAILEFSQPHGRLFSKVYGFYSRQILPRVGRLLSGSRDAYSYLPESVRRFPGAGDLAAQMRAAGFRDVTYQRMTAGIVVLHLGTR